MGIFSFLGNKDRRVGQPVSGDNVPRRRREDFPTPADANTAPARAPHSHDIQRAAARKTALKIDAIESEMSSELTRASTPRQATNNSGIKGGRAAMGSASRSEQTFVETLPAMSMSTDLLLDAEGDLPPVNTTASESAAIIDEAAILFANDQDEMVESMLAGALEAETLGDAARTVWWMLFDLYQITDKRLPFENLAIAYASKFETSPPTWVAPEAQGAASSDSGQGSPSTIAFSGKLDESIQKQLDRALKMGAGNATLRLEFTRITTITPEGCGLLLDTLKKLQKTGCGLVLVNAADFCGKVRGILEVGRKDETDAPWLLLLEVLQLINREQEFEEASIDYCVTYEVSPPAFVAPKSKITTLADDNLSVSTPTNVFLMPTHMDSKSDLIDTISKFAAQHNPAIIDCSRLARVDFSAASMLLSGLAPLGVNGRVIELHNVNQLITALFRVMGLSDIARVLPRKH